MSDPRPSRRAPERYERFIPIALTVLAILLFLLLIAVLAIVLNTL